VAVEVWAVDGRLRVGVWVPGGVDADVIGKAVGRALPAQDSLELREDVTLLDEPGRRRLPEYWEQAIREGRVRAARRQRRRVSLGELDERRGRRADRRSLALVACAGQLTPSGCRPSTSG
jgi:hypothetical protein